MSLKRVVTVFVLVLLCFSLCSCSKKEEISDSTDVMYTDHKDGDQIYIFQIDGHTYTVENMYEVDIYDRTLQDGRFYELTADIEYLNGGIAGYVDFPEIKSILDCQEVSPYEIGLPSIKEKRYGLMIIGDYADGDILLNERIGVAVWKDGEWIWHYDKSEEGEDGTLISYRKDVNKEHI